MPQMNWLAVVAAAVSAFVLGGLWYGPLFKHAWCREAGVNPDQPNGHPGIVFGLGFVLSLIAATVFAMFLGPNPGLHFALGAGFGAGLCWVATSFGINYLFEKKSLPLFLINGGYHAVQFPLIGLILGLWH